MKAGYFMKSMTCRNGVTCRGPIIVFYPFFFFEKKMDMVYTQFNVSLVKTV
jgi:hypothetical protein